VGELFRDGRIIDCILALVCVEIIVMILIHKRTGRGLRPFDLIVSLLAGVALLLAVRAALIGLAWPAIAFLLFLALVAHLVDLARRWTTA
jgi:hypothetical protein